MTDHADETQVDPMRDDGTFEVAKGAVIIGVGKATVDATLGIRVVPAGSESPLSAAVAAFGIDVLKIGPTVYLYPEDRREAGIQKRYEEAGGDVMLGDEVRSKRGSYRFFRRAAVVYNRRKERAYLVRDAIFDKWQALGGLDWGTPNSDEDYVGDGRGRVCHFDDGDERKSIYWILNLGAHEVHGAIRECWRGLGGPSSWLGYPITDEESFPEGGRASQFENGGIYWWSDIGAIPLGDVVVQYTGFHCFGETNWDGGSNSDEPYFVLTPVGASGTVTHTTRIYEDVDSGEQRVDPFEIYRSKPYGISLGVVAMEHDHGDANWVKNTISSLSNQVYQLASGVPSTSSGTNSLLEFWLTKYIPALGELLDNAIDWGDDVLAGYVLTLSARDMVLLAARTSAGSYGAIPYKLKTGPMSGHGATYKAYFNVF